MPSLVLVRHGNTFEKGETPTFVGGRTDMKLTETGECQGQAIAAMIAAQFLPLSGIVSGPLLRTHRFAERIAAAANTVFTIDERLCEIDYGLWENKKTDEVKALYGAESVEAWEKEGRWPDDMNWAPSETKLIHNVNSLLNEQHKKLTAPKGNHRVIVTSNGILRFVYRAITGKAPDSAAKVGTGNFCVLTPQEGGGWSIESWNKKPD